MKNKLLTIYLASLVVCLYSCNTDDVLSDIEGLPVSVINDDPDGAPDRILAQTWNNRNDTLYRQYYDDYVAVYYDDKVERPLEWPYSFLNNLWEFTHDTYGKLGNQRLYGVFHTEGTPFNTTYFNEEHGGRNIIDIPLNGSEITSDNTDTIILEASQIVESATNNTYGSPASNLWGDQWSQLYLYDVYSNLGMTADSLRVYEKNISTTVDYPSPGSNWFKDWFLPIYNDHGGSNALSRFFKISSERYPKLDGSYTSQMNMGEFVHFYSGSVGSDLQALAESAFGWTEEWAGELIQAKMDYPDMPYDFEPVTEIVDITEEGAATITVNYENPGGPEAGEGSMKLIDMDTASKYLTFNYAPDLFLQQIFGGEAQIVNRYTLTSANDAPSRDPKTWQLMGSNNGSDWTLLDSRSNQSFASRGQTVEFSFENETAYTFYRLLVTENNGNGLFQLAEWRLKILRLIEP